MSATRREWAVRLALLGGSLAVCLVLAELVVRAAIPQMYSITWQERDARGLMVNRAGEVVEHAAYGRRTEYRLNDRRLRGGPVPEDGLKVLILGDSFAFGWLLEEDSTSVARLQARAASAFGAGAVRFLNGGTADWGTADYVAFVERYGEAIDPDMIVIFFNFLDVARAGRGLYGVQDGGLVERVPPVPRQGPITGALERIPGFDAFRRRSHLYLAVRAGVNRLGLIARGDEAVPREVAEQSAATTAELARALFVRLSEWAEERDVPLVVLSSGYLGYGYPERDAAGEPVWSAPRVAVDPNQRFIASADSFFSAHGIPWHEISGEVEAAAGGDMDVLIIARDGHPNDHGARLVAEAAWPRLAPHLAAALEGRR